MMALGFPNKLQSAFLVSAIVWAAVALMLCLSSCQAFLVTPTTSRAKTVAGMVIDDPHFIDPNRIDLILEDRKCFTLMDGPVEVMDAAKGVMFGKYQRLLIALPVTLLWSKPCKTMMIPFLIDTASPYTYLSRDAIDMYGIKLPPGNFMANINGVRMPTDVSPPNSHFSDICVLGSNYLFRSSSKLTCFYESWVFLMERKKGVIESAESALLRETKPEAQTSA
jgi:hypothetical protein